MMIENIHIIQMHPLQALIQTGNQVFSAAVIAVRAFPHIVARLGGNHQFIAVRPPIAIHMHAEITLRFAVGRPIIVRQIKMRNALIKRRAEQLLLHAEGRDVSKIVPQTDRKSGQQQPTAPAAIVLHVLIAILRWNIHE